MLLHDASQLKHFSFQCFAQGHLCFTCYTGKRPFVQGRPASEPRGRLPFTAWYCCCDEAATPASWWRDLYLSAIQSFILTQCSKHVVATLEASRSVSQNQESLLVPKRSSSSQEKVPGWFSGSWHSAWAVIIPLFLLSKLCDLVFWCLWNKPTPNMLHPSFKIYFCLPKRLRE